MEVIIAIIMLSVVMISLLQVKSDNIFIITKSKEKSILTDYLQLVINLEEKNDINENIFLDKLYSFENDEIRKELKPIKIKVKNEELDIKSYDNDASNFNITTYKTTYSIDTDIKKNIYTFKIEL